MTATLQTTSSSVDPNVFDISTLRPGQILTLECDKGYRWFISLTDEFRRHGDTIHGVMVMTNSPSRGSRTGRPPGEMAIGRHAQIGKGLRIGYGRTEIVLNYSVSNRPMGP
jgi:hypothetical protein